MITLLSMYEDFPSMRDLDIRRRQAGVSILALCRTAKLAPYTYHRARKNGVAGVRLATMRRLYEALGKLELEKGIGT